MSPLAPLAISAENAVGLGVALVLLAFVVCALLFPERF
ncbi:hypothetical protein SAMN04488544_0848 [Microlunatus sagamiharensis]|uniref:K+-transporting ATPase, KdpF subunit n=1 Tax=Microlunatus sagamiharensis TaxID=546874 RepID=A0A1H2LU04_9ACTN|nr:potassium-transporting ATPase subunit F [Microlunatus sagamiharensis]SDU84500.1 hypothetical protein SAMN04488544_0848 [Microlunatus sagamiharensis]